MQHARLAGPVAHPQPERVPVRRAVRRARRDHPRATQRRAAHAVLIQGLRVALHHPLDLRGGLPLDPGDRDVRHGPGASSATSTSRSAIPARPSCGSSPSFAELTGEVSHALREEPTRDVGRRAPGARRARSDGAARATASALGVEVVPRRGHRAVHRLLDRDRRLVLHLLSPAEAPPPVPHAAAPPGARRRVPRQPQPQRAAAGAVELDEGRDGRPGHRDRARHALRDPHEPGEVDRALAVPLRRRAADDPDPRARAADRLLVRLQLPQPRDRLRAHRDLPDHHQHAVRAAVGRPGPARPLHAARRRVDARASGSCSCPRACPRSSPASASRPAWP